MVLKSVTNFSLALTTFFFLFFQSLIHIF